MAGGRPKLSAICVDTLYHPLAERAARVCGRSGLFDEVLLLTDRPASVPHALIAPLSSIRDYSRFIVREAPRYVSGEHVVVFQWDGFVLDPAAFDPGFLDFDYIGAPWVPGGPQDVGNGGFSLRSRRLLEAARQEAEAHGYDGAEPEDVWICRTMRPVLEDRYGLRFAPPEVGRRFSTEYLRTPGRRSFGFHGAFNIPLLLPEQDIREILHLLPDRLWEGKTLWRWIATAACERDAALGRRLDRYARQAFPEKTRHWPSPATLERRLWKTRLRRLFT